MPEIISRKEARELGLKRYFTGKPCCRAHISERMLQGACVQCNSIPRLYSRAKERFCRLCKKEITGFPSRSRFCSEECSSDWRSARLRSYQRSTARIESQKRRAKTEKYKEKRRKRSQKHYFNKSQSPEWKRNRLLKREARNRKATAALRALEQLGIEI